MKAMAFTEHGSVFEWWHKKSAIEAAGMKYIHGIEAYLTLNIDEKSETTTTVSCLRRTTMGS